MLTQEHVHEELGEPIEGDTDVDARRAQRQVVIEPDALQYGASCAPVSGRGDVRSALLNALMMK